jgi:hypothetical protein
VRAHTRVHIDTDIPLFDLINTFPVILIAGGPHADSFLLFGFLF